MRYLSTSTSPHSWIKFSTTGDKIQKNNAVIAKNVVVSRPPFSSVSTSTTLAEKPMAEKPAVEKPHAEKPHVDKPAVVKSSRSIISFSSSRDEQSTCQSTAVSSSAGHSRGTHGGLSLETVSLASRMMDSTATPKDDIVQQHETPKSETSTTSSAFMAGRSFWMKLMDAGPSPASNSQNAVGGKVTPMGQMIQPAWTDGSPLSEGSDFEGQQQHQQQDHHRNHRDNLENTSISFHQKVIPKTQTQDSNLEFGKENNSERTASKRSIRPHFIDSPLGLQQPSQKVTAKTQQNDQNLEHGKENNSERSASKRSIRPHFIDSPLGLSVRNNNNNNNNSATTPGAVSVDSRARQFGDVTNRRFGSTSQNNDTTLVPKPLDSLTKSLEDGTSLKISTTITPTTAHLQEEKPETQSLVSQGSTYRMEKQAGLFNNNTPSPLSIEISSRKRIFRGLARDRVQVASVSCPNPGPTSDPKNASLENQTIPTPKDSDMMCDSDQPIIDVVADSNPFKVTLRSIKSPRFPTSTTPTNSQETNNNEKEQPQTSDTADQTKTFIPSCRSNSFPVFKKPDSKAHTVTQGPKRAQSADDGDTEPSLALPIRTDSGNSADSNSTPTNAMIQNLPTIENSPLKLQEIPSSSSFPRREAEQALVPAGKFHNLLNHWNKSTCSFGSTSDQQEKPISSMLHPQETSLLSKERLKEDMDSKEKTKEADSVVKGTPPLVANRIQSFDKDFFDILREKAARVAPPSKLKVTPESNLPTIIPPHDGDRPPRSRSSSPHGSVESGNQFCQMVVADSRHMEMPTKSRAMVILETKNQEFQIVVGDAESGSDPQQMIIRNVETVTSNEQETRLTKYVPCECSKSVFSGNDDLISFFLPKMGMACTCGKHTNGMVNKDDPTAVENILRPWQVDFLKSFGIFRGEELVKARHRSADLLAKALRQWRRKKGMAPFKTSSCAMALHIWSKTCKAYVRSVRKLLQQGQSLALLEKQPFVAEMSHFLNDLPSAPIRRRTEDSQLLDIDIELDSQVEV